jgi:ferredoxin
VKVVIDLDLCAGHGQCEEAAPNVFEVRDDGFAYVRTEDIPEGEFANAREAASRCPADAIRITE